MFFLLACDDPPGERIAQEEGCAYSAMASALPQPDVCPPDAAAYDPSALETPNLVVLFTMDALNREYFGGRHPEWDVTPRIDAFVEESAWLPNVLVPRGLTGVTLTSLLTGLYPRHHGVRTHDEQVPTSEITLPERYSAAGYSTHVFLANQCWVVDGKVDQTECTWDEPQADDQQDRDWPLTDAAVKLIHGRDPAEKMFIWVHLIDAHDPYTQRDPYYDEFHPDDYRGEFQTAGEGKMIEVQLGLRRVSDKDQAHIEAMYASQVRLLDDQFGQILDAIDDTNSVGFDASTSEAVVAIGTDHGEELGLHRHYYWHGCSPYNSVLASSYAIRAPGRLAAGEVNTAWVSSTDIAPTLLELSGLPAAEGLDGASLVADLQSCTDPGRPVYFERAVGSAGMIKDGYKVYYDPQGAFSDCTPYDVETPYVDDGESVYALDVDPDECENLREAEPDRWTAMRAELCAWVTGESWSDDDGDNALMDACQ